MKRCLHFFSLSALWIGMISGCGMVYGQTNSTVYVTFWFDTEDYILPEADDAALRLAEMFTERNVQATFKIVGEKARVLEERGRDDVIAALARNDISYHSTNHSQHPTPSEYTRDLGWQEGVDEFSRRESIGLSVLQRVFGVNASCYGQPGCSWTPQSYAALREWGIPLYLDATWQVNVDNRPFWYGGLLNVLDLGDCIIRTEWSDEDVKKACAEFDRVSQRLKKEGGGLISVYYHPCEFLHEEFWDGVNFSRGANPPREEWKLPPKKTPEQIEQCFNAFEAFLDHVIKQPATRLVTAREIPSLYPDRAYTCPLERAELNAIASQFMNGVTYTDLGGRFVTAGEGLFALASFVSEMGEDWEPESVDVEFAYGPAGRPDKFITEGSFRWDAIQKAAVSVVERIYDSEQLPSVVWVDGKPLRPEDFAVTLASAILADQRLDMVPFVRGELTAAELVRDDAPGRWDWVIFPEGFHAPRLMDVAKLQSWTIKPARLRR